ncbi:MAG: hypothetical protein ACI30W_03235 [Muribaculaceae bacterium]
MRVCIYIDLPDYLREWFIDDCGGLDGGAVKVRRGSAESNFLGVFLAKRPIGVNPEPPGDRLAVRIPMFRGRNPEDYNYLPPYAMGAFIELLRRRFDVQLWHELYGFANIGRKQDAMIYAYMEKHGISATDKNWQAVAKRYARLRKIYAAREERKKK